MPVPKKRLGSARQNSRRANWKGFMPAMTNCSNCGSPKLSHHVCGVCGYYKGRLVSQRFAKAGMSYDLADESQVAAPEVETDAQEPSAE